jgi:hypothetical protein
MKQKWPFLLQCCITQRKKIVQRSTKTQIKAKDSRFRML